MIAQSSFRIFLASLPRRWDPDHREDSPFGVAAPGNEAGLKLPKVIWNRWVGDYCSTMKIVVLLVSMYAWLQYISFIWHGQHHSFLTGFGNTCSKARGAIVSPKGLVSPFCVQFGERISCPKLLHFKSRNCSFWTVDMPFFCLVHV